MRHTRRFGVPVLLLFAVPLLGQDVRDTRPGAPPPPPVGTSRISGQVVAADSGTPVKRATINIIGRMVAAPVEGGRASMGMVGMVVGGRGGSQFPPQVTDEAGRFEFGDLPAGTYSIMVSPRSGFVRPQRIQQVEVEDGKAASISIRLERTGVISGRLLDESGEPLPRARVSAMRRERMAGGRIMNTGMGDTTDDLGQFRLFDLPPGEYFVHAQDSNINYAPMNAPMNTASPPQGFAPTYYPGSASLDGARGVTVRSAQETPGIEFSLVRVAMGRITGTVRDSSGQVVSGRGGSVNVTRRGSDAMGFTRGSGVRPDGTFTINDVPPGEYYLLASVSTTEGPNAQREGAYVPVAVNGNDLAIDIQTNRGATVRGRVIVEGTPQAPPPEFLSRPDAGRITVSPRMMTMGGPLGMVSGGVRPATVNDDGTFELAGLRGPLLITASGMRMALKSVTHGAEDLTARPMEFKGTERVSNVAIVLTHDVGTLEGTVTDERGEPVPGAGVIIFPDDEDRWFPNSPFVHLARAMPAMPAGARPQAASRPGPLTESRPVRAPGSFASMGLLPGRYFVAAVQGEAGIPPPDRESLERLRKEAVVATVTVGAPASVQLRVVKAF